MIRSLASALAFGVAYGAILAALLIRVTQVSPW